MNPGSAGIEVWIYIQVSNQNHKDGTPSTVHATAIFAEMSARYRYLLLFIFMWPSNCTNMRLSNCIHLCFHREVAVPSHFGCLLVVLVSL